MPELLTEQQVSDLLGVPVKTLQAWRHYMKGPNYVKYGRHIRYKKTDIENFLNEHTINL